jgi:uracil-DNA glycosylase
VFLTAELRLLSRARVVLALGRIGHEAWLRASGWWERLPARERPRFAHGRKQRCPTASRCSRASTRAGRTRRTGKLTLPMWRAVFARARRLVDAA